MKTQTAAHRPAYQPIATQQCPQPGVCVLQPRGRLDLATSPELGEALQSALTRAQRLLVIDLAAVTFMDSTAIGHMLRAIRQLAPGARLALCRLPGYLRVPLEMAGILDAGTGRPDGATAHLALEHIVPLAGPAVQVAAALADRVCLFADVPTAVQNIQNSSVIAVRS